MTDGGVHARAVARRRRIGSLGLTDLALAVEGVLFVDDPIGINYETNLDEYRPEAETIVLRLPEAHSRVDVHQIVWEEFVNWFGADIAKSPERYEAVSDTIWNLWTAELNRVTKPPQLHDPH